MLRRAMDRPFVYLDHNATTPLDPRVAEAMRPCLDGLYGNPSSHHRAGREARARLEAARAEIAACLGAAPDELVLGSGGSEANNLALRGAVEARGGGHVVTTAIEHPAVLEVLRALERAGRITLSLVAPEPDGRVRAQAVLAACRPDTILVSVMLANNETGALQPVAEIAAGLAGRGVLVHTDAAQAVGKIPVDVGALGVDLLSLAGHKLYAPKGVGALYVRRGVALAPQILGASHESGRRAGTESVLGAVGLGAACRLVREGLARDLAHTQRLRDRLQALLQDAFPDAVVHGPREARLPNTLSIALPGLTADPLLRRLSDEVAASAGAACHAEEVSVSHVLAAMGVGPELALATLRLSVGRASRDEEIEQAAARIVELARELRGPGDGPAPVASTGEVRLTEHTRGLGCGCKLGPQVLRALRHTLPAPRHAEVVVGFESSDDAAVWRLPDGRLLVQTIDVFTPIVDDPRAFGAIAAVNALSDVYAMGARPAFALQLVGFPIGRLPEAVLHAMLEGAAEVAEEAGVDVLGGHSIEDPEPKLGWCVTGFTTEAGLWTNAGARPGDALLLTKALGTGALATARARRDLDDAPWAAAVASMRRLNRVAAEVLTDFAPHAATDVTGFGLLGHLGGLLAASGVDASLVASKLPVLEGAEAALVGGHAPGGTLRNLADAERFTRFAPPIPRVRRLLLADAQTSGGLLVALPEARAEAARAALVAAGETATIVGRVRSAGEGRVEVVEA